MTGQLALVTGASGFIASHVIEQLLQKGYRIRGTVRGSKIKSLRNTVVLPGLEFAQVDDLAKDDISKVLEGVDVVFHVAAPQVGTASVEDTIKGSLDGTLNVLTQAEKAGIEKIVITSTAGTVIDPDFKQLFAGITFTESNWGTAPSVDVIHAQAENSLFVYFCAKILAEKAVWEFARKHPMLDISTILPGLVIGPYAAHFPVPPKTSMGTNDHIYDMLHGKAPRQSIPHLVDVRDVAKAHILALELPRAKPDSPEDKRFLVSWGLYGWKQLAEYLKTTYTGFRVVNPDTLQDFPPSMSRMDAKRSREVLNLTYTSPEKTLEDLIGSIAEAEKVWASSA